VLAGGKTGEESAAWNEKRCSSNVFSPLRSEKIPKDVVELNGIEPSAS
jgi:hypothetical protein